MIFKQAIEILYSDRNASLYCKHDGDTFLLKQGYSVTDCCWIIIQDNGTYPSLEITNILKEEEWENGFIRNQTVI